MRGGDASSQEEKADKSGPITSSQGLHHGISTVHWFWQERFPELHAHTDSPWSVHFQGRPQILIRHLGKPVAYQKWKSKLPNCQHPLLHPLSPTVERRWGQHHRPRMMISDGLSLLPSAGSEDFVGVTSRAVPAEASPSSSRI